MFIYTDISMGGSEFMSVYMQRIDTNLHEKMKSLAKMKGTRSVTEEYRMAIEAWIANETQNILLADSQIVSRLEDRITKAEDRLAKISGRVGMDVSVTLMAILNLLAKQHGVTEEMIYNELRPVAVNHFTKTKKDSIPGQ